MKKVRWAVLGTGQVVGEFIRATAQLSDADVTFVGSRSQERARVFAQELDIDTATGVYQDVLTRNDVDVVYIAAVNTLHADLIVECLAHGLHVLCEKPLVTTLDEAHRVIDAAKQYERFCMEALWSRFTPGISHAKQLISSGELGELKHISATYGHAADLSEITWRLEPGLGSGVLLDLGSYVVSLIHYLAGDLVSGEAQARTNAHGVDTHAAFTLCGKDGFIASGCVSFDTTLPTNMVLYGSKGVLTIGNPIYNPRSVVFDPDDEAFALPTWIPAATLASRVVRKVGRSVEPVIRRLSKTTTFPSEKHGFCYQIEHVHACLRQGLKDSPIMPLQDSAHCIGTIDQLRKSL